MLTVYEDQYVTEYNDGTEEVRFNDSEWRAMMQDPVYFGYSCNQGHRIREDDPFVIAEGCPTCFAWNESGNDGPGPASHFPKIACGHCKGSHIGIGAVRRCSNSSLR